MNFLNGLCIFVFRAIICMISTGKKRIISGCWIHKVARDAFCINNVLDLFFSFFSIPRKKSRCFYHHDASSLSNILLFVSCAHVDTNAALRAALQDDKCANWMLHICPVYIYVAWSPLLLFIVTIFINLFSVYFRPVIINKRAIHTL